MGARVVFVDTVALLALANRSDGLHSATCAVWDKLNTEHANLVTSDWVLAEFLSGARRQPLRTAASEMVRRLRGSKRTNIVQADRNTWEETFTLYEDRPDKEWSFVDCSSILICQDNRISEVLTNDRHFRQAGLTTLLS